MLHDQEGHPRLSTTHRGDRHLTIGVPLLLQRYERAIDLVYLDCLIVDREGMAAEFLFQLHSEGRRVVTLLKVNQYEDEGSFTEVGEWVPWRSDRSGRVVCEVAVARFQLARPGQPDQPLALRAEWEVHHRRVLLQATNVAGKRELNHCERSCRALRHVLRKPRRATCMRTGKAGTG